MKNDGKKGVIVPNARVTTQLPDRHSYQTDTVARQTQLPNFAWER